MNELRDKIRAHLKWGPLEGRDRVRFMTLALCGEVGELVNLVKKDWRGDAGDRRDKMIGELVDVANYTLMLAEACGLELPDGFFPSAHSSGLDDLGREHLQSVALILCAKAYRVASAVDACESPVVPICEIGPVIVHFADLMHVDLPSRMLAKLQEVEQRPEFMAAHLKEASQ